MFDIGFSEVLLIFVIALVVLGPEKLPRLASQVGRWIGRARAMARQFREQLEEEVNLEEVRRAHEQRPKKPADAPAATSVATVGTSPTAGASTGVAEEGSGTPAAEYQGYQGPDPGELRADTFSHAHPTNEVGANPHTADGAGTPTVAPVDSTPSEANVASALSESSAPREPTTAPGEAYASNTQAATAATTREPTAPPATQDPDSHGQS